MLVALFEGLGPLTTILALTRYRNYHILRTNTLIPNYLYLRRLYDTETERIDLPPECAAATS
jgi:hypothetical protein